MEMRVVPGWECLRVADDGSRVESCLRKGRAGGMDPTRWKSLKLRANKLGYIVIAAWDWRIHWQSKLTEAIVAEARLRHQAGESQASLARAFGVTSPAMHYAIVGRNWKQVTA